MHFYHESIKGYGVEKRSSSQMLFIAIAITVKVKPFFNILIKEMSGLESQRMAFIGIYKKSFFVVICHYPMENWLFVGKKRAIV